MSPIREVVGQKVELVKDRRGNKHMAELGFDDTPTSVADVVGSNFNQLNLGIDPERNGATIAAMALKRALQNRNE